MSTLIKEAVDAAHGVAKVAETFGIARVSVYEWISKDRLPADRVIPLAELTVWRYTPHMLDSTLYPHKHDGLPDSIREQLAADDRRSLRERRHFADRRATERKAAAAAADGKKASP
jgi:hypothetical protein